MKLETLNISKTAFWDVNYSELDADVSSIFIIGKVLAYGSYSDMKALIKYYGVLKIKQDVKLANSLDPKTLNFISKMLGIHPTEFSCYKRIQLVRNSGSYYSN